MHLFLADLWHREEGNIVRVTFDDKSGNAQDYYIHENVIAEASTSLFDDIVAKEGALPQLDLGGLATFHSVNYDDEVYELLVYFIVHEALPEANVTTEQENQATQLLLIEVWKLAYNLRMPKLQNATMLVLLQFASQYATPAEGVQNVLECFEAPDWTPVEQFVVEQAALGMLKYKTISFCTDWRSAHDTGDIEIKKALDKLIQNDTVFDDRASEGQRVKYMVDEDVMDSDADDDSE